MPKLDIGTNLFTEVNYEELDSPDSLVYMIGKKVDSGMGAPPTGDFGFIEFQRGPMRSDDVNGCAPEDVLAILIHRFRTIQDSPNKCREFSLVLTKLEEAMHWLEHKENSLLKRGLQGRHEK